MGSTKIWGSIDSFGQQFQEGQHSFGTKKLGGSKIVESNLLWGEKKWTQMSGVNNLFEQKFWGVNKCLVQQFWRVNLFGGAETECMRYGKAKTSFDICYILDGFSGISRLCEHIFKYSFFNAF